MAITNYGDHFAPFRSFEEPNFIRQTQVAGVVWISFDGSRVIHTDTHMADARTLEMGATLLIFSVWRTHSHTHICINSSPATRQWDACGERRYSSYSFTTSAQDGGECSASRPGRALHPGKVTTVPNLQEAGWAPEPVWTMRLEKHLFSLCRALNPDRPVVQSVVRHYTDWATPAHHIYAYVCLQAI
jgi:hypothetical protein